MKNYNNPYERIQLYYSLLINDKTVVMVDDSFRLGITLNRIHEISDLPLEIIREDFLQMFAWQGSLSTYACKEDSIVSACDRFLSFDDEDSTFHNLNDTYQLQNLYTELMSKGTVPDRFKEILSSGILDNIPIYMSNTVALHHLPLTMEEAAALRQHRDQKFSSHVSSNSLDTTYNYSFDIKDSFLFSHYYVDLNERLDCINLAIRDNLPLSIRYKTSKGNIIFTDFKPLKISYDADEDLYCILCVQNDKIQVYRLDHILALEISNETIKDSSDDCLSKMAPNVWGNCFSHTPEKVKVKFYNEANVWEKVKKDLAYRINGKLYKKDGFLYYEDIVYGLDKFRSWIYGYGSSAIVLSPKKLQDQIISSLKERLEDD